MSSSCMISDHLRVNNINPFVENMPGSWNAPYDYSVSDTMHKEPPAQWEHKEESHVCDTQLTAGDNTIGMCRPSKPNCPMSRFQEPRRLYDPGFWEAPKNSQNSKNIGNMLNIKNIDHIFLMVLIVCIIIVFLSIPVRRRYSVSRRL